MLMDLDDVESGGPGFALVEEPLSMIRSAECIDDRFPGRCASRLKSNVRFQSNLCFCRLKMLHSVARWGLMGRYERFPGRCPFLDSVKP